MLRTTCIALLVGGLTGCRLLDLQLLDRGDDDVASDNWDDRETDADADADTDTDTDADADADSDTDTDADTDAQQDWSVAGTFTIWYDFGYEYEEYGYVDCWEDYSVRTKDFSSPGGCSDCDMAAALEFNPGDNSCGWEDSERIAAYVGLDSVIGDLYLYEEGTWYHWMDGFSEGRSYAGDSAWLAMDGYDVSYDIMLSW